MFRLYVYSSRKWNDEMAFSHQQIQSEMNKNQMKSNLYRIKRISKVYKQYICQIAQHQVQIADTCRCVNSLRSKSLHR